MTQARTLADLARTTTTTAELNKLDGFTGVAADLNYAKDLKATGVTTTEFDHLDGVTSNLQTQLGVTDITSSFTLTGSPWSQWGTWKAYHFNGFVFLQISAYAAAATLAQHENFARITNSAYYPSYNAKFVTVNHQGETASEVSIPANQQYIQVRDIYNGSTDSTFRVSINGWYKT